MAKGPAMKRWGSGLFAWAWVASVAAGIVMIAPREVVAQQVIDPARIAFDRGMEALNANRYADAARAFEQSYHLRPVPIVLYNLGLAWRGLGRNREASSAFERFLREPGPNIEATRIAAVQREVEALRASLVQVQLVIDPRDATVLIDGRAVVATGGFLTIDPGRHVVEFRADGRLSQRREEEFAIGARPRWTVMLTAIAPTNGGTAGGAESLGPVRTPDDGRDRPRAGLSPVETPSSEAGVAAGRASSSGSSRGWVVPVVIVGSLLVAAGVGVGIWALTGDSTVTAPPTTTGWTIETITTR